MAKTKKKLPSKKTINRRLDNIVRELCEQLYGNICQTCHIHKRDTPAKQLHWSHYISRRYAITRHDIRNCLPQCAACHGRYTDGFCGPMVKAINRIWGEFPVTDVRLQDKGIFKYDMTDWLEKLVNAQPSCKGTPWDKVDFRVDLERKYKFLYNYIYAGFHPSLEQLAYMKKYGYPDDEELNSQFKP